MNNTNRVYYPYFDILRFVLASVVMLWHDKVIGGAYTGRMAVDVFFALSGWLIGGILLNMQKEGLPRFYFNRALRIWVPYYIAFTLIVTASLIKDPIDTKWFEFIIYKFTWVYNLFGPPQLADAWKDMPLDGTGNHFWTVNAEEQFYLLAPILLVVFAQFGKTITSWVIISVITLALNIYPAISFGVLAAVLHKNFPYFYTNTHYRLLLAAALIFGLAGILFTSQQYLFSPFFAVSTVLLLATPGQKNFIGSFLGGLSYPLYLNHWIGVYLFNVILDPFGLRDSELRQILAALSNYAIAGILYWYVDRNIIRARNRVFHPTKAKILMTLAYLLILLGIVFGIYHTQMTIYTLLLFVLMAAFLITLTIKHKVPT